MLRLTTGTKVILIYCVFVVAALYCFANPKPHNFYDYTFRIAGAILDGRLGLIETPPSWLNEMIPHEGRFYSVFPLGSVLTMLPVAALQKIGVVKSFPARALVVLIASITAALCFLIASRHPDLTAGRRVVLLLFVVLGTWMWANLGFGGAWQMALGFAVIGQLAALYFVLVDSRPLLAGCFFAMAFGNRTEVLLLTPIFIYLLCRNSLTKRNDLLDLNRLSNVLKQHWPTIAKFVAVPFVLGVATLAYNYARFGSPFDFGYARIPGVLDEPWYEHGIFSVRAIPRNAEQMLFQSWKFIETYPYLTPTGFGGSIFLSSPFLFLVFRPGARELAVKRAAWVAIIILTLLLWCHGNPGGWQYSYRYAMVLLPWIVLILLENSPLKVTITEVALLILSIAINAYATYLFLWTDYVRP